MSHSAETVRQHPNLAPTSGSSATFSSVRRQFIHTRHRGQRRFERREVVSEYWRTDDRFHGSTGGVARVRFATVGGGSRARPTLSVGSAQLEPVVGRNHWCESFVTVCTISVLSMPRRYTEVMARLACPS